MKSTLSFLLFCLLFLSNTSAKIEWEKLLLTFPVGEGVQEIISPAMSYRTLLEWGSAGNYHCLIYKISSRERASGILYLGKRSQRGCSLSRRKQDEVLFDRIRSLKVKLTKSNRGQSYQVAFRDVDGKEQVRKWQFPFGSKKFSRWKGLSLHLNIRSKKTVLEEDKVCSFFDREKMKVNFDNCGQCKNNLWTPILNRLSASDPVAICGARRCGERNQNPCLKMTSIKSPVSCEEAKKLVYCQSGRNLICLASGFLECR